MAIKDVHTERTTVQTADRAMIIQHVHPCYVIDYEHYVRFYNKNGEYEQFDAKWLAEICFLMKRVGIRTTREVLTSRLFETEIRQIEEAFNDQS